MRERWRDFSVRWGTHCRLEGQGNEAGGETGSSQGARRAGGGELLSLHRGDTGTARQNGARKALRDPGQEAGVVMQKEVGDLCLPCHSSRCTECIQCGIMP